MIILLIGILTIVIFTIAMFAIVIPGMLIALMGLHSVKLCLPQLVDTVQFPPSSSSNVPCLARRVPVGDEVGEPGLDRLFPLASVICTSGTRGGLPTVRPACHPTFGGGGPIDIRNDLATSLRRALVRWPVFAVDVDA